MTVVWVSLQANELCSNTFIARLRRSALFAAVYCARIFGHIEIYNSLILCITGNGQRRALPIELPSHLVDL